MSADLRATRRTRVQELRVVARACQVTAVKDDAKRDKVQEMMNAIRASGGPGDEKRKAETAFAAYEATFAEQAPQPEAAQEAGFRLRGKSFLLTYNWNYLHKDFPDGTPAPETYADLWHLWLEWKKEKKKELKV